MLYKTNQPLPRDAGHGNAPPAAGDTPGHLKVAVSRHKHKSEWSRTVSIPSLSPCSDHPWITWAPPLWWYSKSIKTIGLIIRNYAMLCSEFFSSNPSDMGKMTKALVLYWDIKGKENFSQTQISHLSGEMLVFISCESQREFLLWLKMGESQSNLRGLWMCGLRQQLHNAFPHMWYVFLKILILHL